MPGWFRKGLFLPLAIVFAAGFAGVHARPVYAVEPILMLLINLGRDMIEARENARQRPPVPVVPEIAWPDTYPGTTVTPGLVKRLIDDCFEYLSSRQRDELFAQLNVVLLDPKNAMVRASLIEHFASRAVSVRQARIYLSKLSSRDKQALVSQFKDEVSLLSDDDRKLFVEVVRNGMLPVPQDLNQLFLAVLQPG